MALRLPQNLKGAGLFLAPPERKNLDGQIA